MALSVPTVHLNGTSQTELLTQLTTAADAVRDAITAVQKACPNGRDYYPQGRDATQEALRQHANRLHNLTAVRRELVEIAEAIA